MKVLAFQRCPEQASSRIAVYDELLTRFADAPELTIGQLVEMVRKVRADAER